MLVWNVLSDGGNEFLGGEDLEVFLVAPVSHRRPVKDLARVLQVGDLLFREGVSEDIFRQRLLTVPIISGYALAGMHGLFAEVIRRSGLTELIQREHRVVIAGPTTLWSLLSSLQMGFRILAIQKRSSEVWNLLAAVKTEWTKYGDVLEAVQRKLHQASDTIEKAKVRSRAVGRKLKDVQELPLTEAAVLLPAIGIEEEGPSDEDDDQ